MNAIAETKVNSFDKPIPKGQIKMVDADNLDELINLLHNEAKQYKSPFLG